MFVDNIDNTTSQGSPVDSLALDCGDNFKSGHLRYPRSYLFKIMITTYLTNFSQEKRCVDSKHFKSFPLKSDSAIKIEPEVNIREQLLCCIEVVF